VADDGEEERRRGSGGGGEGAGGESCLGHRVPTKGFFAFSPPPPFCRMLRLRRDVVPDDDESARERPRVRIPGAELRREQRRRPRGGGLARGLTGKKERKKEKRISTKRTKTSTLSFKTRTLPFLHFNPCISSLMRPAPGPALVLFRLFS